MNAHEWQRDVISDISAQDADGKWIHQRVGLSIPRQVGKSFVLILWAVVLVLLGYKVLWTEHNYSTTCEMLKKFRKIFGRVPNDKNARFMSFNKHVVATSNKTAQESYEFDTGGVLCFATRTKTASLGYSFDVVIYDEAQELTTEHVQAIAPTTGSGAMHNAQFVFAGTPTRAGSHATEFMEFRQEFMADEPPSDACWWEWGVGQPFDVRNRELVMENLPTVNPSLGDTADASAIMAGIVSMHDTFAALQEYFGYWLPKSGVVQTLFDRAQWDVLKVDKPCTDGTRFFGVKYSADGLRVCVCVSTRTARGVFVDAVFDWPTSRATSELAEWLGKRSTGPSTVCIDGKAGADALVKRLQQLGVCQPTVHVMTTSEMVGACSLLKDFINDRTLSHCGQEPLAKSVCGAVRRPIGKDGGWGFGNSELAQCTLAEACAIACWAAFNSSLRYESRIG